MQTVIIEGNEVIYFTKEELLIEENIDNKELHEETYKIADFISRQLKIECPYIGLSGQIRSRDNMGRLSVNGGVTYTPEDVPELDNNLIMMSYEEFIPIQFAGTLAHEMRHIWQAKYHPEINKKHARGFEESLTHPAEIDADGYAIWYISDTPDMDIEKAAEIMCPEEKRYHKNEYQMRIEKAYEIKAYFDELRKKMVAEMEASKKQHKATILDKVINFFKNNGGN